MKNYFALLGLEEKFDLSNNLITQQYFIAQKIHHPDRSGNITVSIALNEAYLHILDPLSRAQHLLELNGVDVFANIYNLDILSKIMDSANTYEKSMGRLTAAFNSNDLYDAYEAWCECQYLKRRRPPN